MAVAPFDLAFRESAAAKAVASRVASGKISKAEHRHA
jgi:hypothetical protein